MRSLDIIYKKRSGDELTQSEIDYIIGEYVAGRTPDYQMSALLMAIYFQGMTASETSFLTRSMIDSGDVINLSSLAAYAQAMLVDKHSTGGVGDKVSLILAPIVASLGLSVPMISGRSLGHTGGTLDKLESIPGYRTNLLPAEFADIIRSCGFAMTSQSERIVPADKKLYALRDASATVESIPLITASILSKKFAEGAQHLVFDVKFGSGAFMKTLPDAQMLADSLVRVGKELGLGTQAVLSRMDTPLGTHIGNFFEVEESIHCLNCKGWETNVGEAGKIARSEKFDSKAGEIAPNDIASGLNISGSSADLMEITLVLAACMLKSVGIVQSIAEGVSASLEALRNGSAVEAFWQNVNLQGGDRFACEALVHRREGLVHKSYKAERDGYINKLDAFLIGRASVLLGAGRNVSSDPVLPNVGIILHAKLGDAVQAGDDIMTLYAQSRVALDNASAVLSGAVRIDSTPNGSRESLVHSIV